MRILAIDPGVQTGLAFFLEGRLVWQATASNDQFWHHIITSRPNVVVCELPEVYRSRHMKGNPNHLIPLARQCGEAKAHAMYQGASYVDVKPKTWKGQLPKHVHHKRIKGQLGRDELPIFEGATEHARDAVGLGLWYQKAYTLVTP